MGAMLISDITKRQSFDDVARWLDELRGHADSNGICPARESLAVPTDDATEFFQRENLFFPETSAIEA
ncbi:hypothetical protein ZIOFF_042689 [Zingiber officinale]|uniref:Uncharacterized protein n=1 Tax=Zingiber officinale TaxID=94328 RepID=A0A8J5KZ00_ZINOF|nr:hypothetical protein ZIOFF_042689 [Zingiber officinale]